MHSSDAQYYSMDKISLVPLPIYTRTKQLIALRFVQSDQMQGNHLDYLAVNGGSLTVTAQGYVRTTFHYYEQQTAAGQAAVCCS